ncbi:putative J domain-containing protein C17A3.05c [Rhodotorula toruloides]|nr:putative J domain-containing protein C17A3.05c [Rhodotorula toruloides]
MVANRDEAQRALAIARGKLEAGQYDSAIRFAKKSIALEASPEAAALLANAEQLQRGGGSVNGTVAAGSSTASTSATSAGQTSGSTSQRAGKAKAETSGAAANDGGGGEYTSAQLAMVKRVKACRVTAYYEILELEKSCSDGQIKKAYRKLALGLHPDKNLAPGAEEAFKMVSKAFQVLSDSNKRAIYDQTGGDPDSRGGGGGGGGGGGFARGPSAAGFQGGGFGGEEISPEDLFRMFFGQGGGGFGGSPFGGGPFGGGPFGGTSFQFYGPGGVRMGSMGGGMPRRAGGQGQQQTPTSMWLQIAPLLFLFAFSLLSQLPSFFGSSSPAPPNFSFDKTNHFSVPRSTASGVKYYVSPDQFAQHPLYESFLSANPSLGFTSSHQPGSAQYRRDLVDHLRRSSATAEPVAEGGGAASEKEKKKSKPVKLPHDMLSFERTVERSWVNRLQTYCRLELNDRNDQLERARGFLGFGTDHDRIAKILAQKLPHCEELSKVPGHGPVY